MPLRTDYPAGGWASADAVAMATQVNGNTSKLAGIANGATANDTDANLKNRGNHTGTQSTDTLVDGVASKTFLAAERTKLAGIATGATVNSTDAALRDRSTHSGQQPSTSISDLTEAVQDIVGTFLASGTNVTVTYDDAGNQLTIAASGGSGGGSTDPEVVRDTIGVALSGIGNISVVVNDAADTIVISTTATVNSTDAALRDRGTHTGTQSADSLVDGTANKAFTAAERTKLAGIAIGATALALGITGTTAAAGNDARLSDTRTPTDGTVTTAKVAPATLVTAAETIAANNNETTLPTSAAVKQHVDAAIAAIVPGGGSSDPAPYTAVLGAITANSTVNFPHSMNTLNLLPPLLLRTYLQNGQTAREVINVTKWGITDLNNAYIEFVDAWAANTLEIIWNGKAMPASWDSLVPGATTLTLGTVAQTTVSMTISHGVDTGVGTAGSYIYRNNTGTGVPLATIPVGTTTFTDTGLTQNTGYSYSSRAFDLNGNVSTVLSNVLTPTTTAAPTAPTFDSMAVATPLTGNSATANPGWTHGTVGGTAASNLGIIAVYETNGGAQSGVPTGAPTATLGGVNLPFLGYQLMDNPAGGWIAVFAGLGVPAGTGKTAAASLAAAGGTFFANVHAVSYVYQGVGSIGALIKASAISTANAVSVPSAVGRRVWGAFGNYQLNTYSAETFTVRQKQAVVSPSYTSGDMPGAAATNLAATESAAVHWAGVGLDMLPV